MAVHQKRLLDDKHLAEETKGYNFFKKYYEKVPIIESIDYENNTIDYEDVSSDSNRRLFDVLNANDSSFDMRASFFDFSCIINRYSIISDEISGGTKKFYFDRVGMISSTRLLEIYTKSTGGHEDFTLNGIKIKPNPLILEAISSFMNEKVETLVAPLQGDFHEMNIFQNGYVIDFEGAGWNRVATDISTFLHHLIAGGNYLGLKYAKWSTPFTANQASGITLKHHDISISLSAARKKLLNEYIENLLEEMNPSIIENINREIGMMLAVRLFTVYDVTKMSDDDQLITFIIANYFFTDGEIIAKLRELFF